ANAPTQPSAPARPVVEATAPGTLQRVAPGAIGLLAVTLAPGDRARVLRVDAAAAALSDRLKPWREVHLAHQRLATDESTRSWRSEQRVDSWRSVRLTLHRDAQPHVGQRPEVAACHL